MQGMQLGHGTYTRNADGQMSRERPLFKVEVVPDEAASASAGRPIGRDVEVVTIVTPGNTLTAWAGRVTDEHRKMWPEEYKAFKEGRELSVDGTPLELWCLMTPGRVFELKGAGLRTVEDVARLNDHDIQRLGMGALQLRNEAQAYLSEADAQKITSQLHAENERKDNEISGLKMQLEQQGKLLAQLHTKIMADGDRPHPLATYVPGEHDPTAPRQPEARDAPTSSLAGFADVERKRRGRPPSVQPAA